MLHKSGRIDEGISSRIKAAWMKWRAATGVLCDRNVPLKLKGKFYRVAIRPAMLYGSECLPITKALANRVEVAELKTIINKMREGRLRWFGHVRRRAQSVRRVEALVVDGLRRRGRSKLRPFVLCVVALLLVFLASLVFCMCRCLCASVFCLFGLLNGCFSCLPARSCFACPRVCMLALRLCDLRCCFRLVLPHMCLCFSFASCSCTFACIVNVGAMNDTPKNLVSWLLGLSVLSVLPTGNLLLRCDSTGDLYPVTQQSFTHPPFALLSFSHTTWHRRLGHPGEDMLRRLEFDEDIFPFAKLHEYTSPTYDFLPTIPLHVSPIPTVAHEQPTTSSHTPSLTGPTNTFSQGPIHHAAPEPINHAAPQPDITNAIQPTTSINTNTDTSPDTMPPIQPSTTNLNNVLPTQPQHPMQQPNIPTQTVNTHPMVTRAKAGISKPLERMNCHVTTVSPLPRSHVHALRDPQWKQAMLDEYNALITNSMWVLVPRPANVNIVCSMWLFKHKFHADGTLSRYKARLVVNGRSQQQGIDCNETFSPVVKPATIHALHLVSQCLVIGLFINLCVRCMGLNRPFVPGFNALLALSHESRIITLLHEVQPVQDPCGYPKLGPDGEPVSDLTLYRSLAGALQYLTFTRPYISYAVQQVCLYMHDPRDPHFTALKRILRYVRGTIDHGLQLHVSSTALLTAYTDAADWAGCPVTRRSTSGYCVFLGDNLLSWSAKWHVTLSRSSAEAEYRGVANVAETAWLRTLLLELHTPLSTATIVYCDNVGAVYLSTNPVQHQLCKTRTFALGDKPHSFFAPEGKPPRRGLNPRPLACGNNLPKVTLGGHLS
uniref:Ribonuclease H-like domain-containing protein n=1 Tax=Tanacetum cinerariifolium TaxID=118510 RepID=A0A6L2JR87_TANCI|nr:ribonuclease H-like domain-containing protein [Tanacetum cinerariifolium]